MSVNITGIDCAEVIGSLLGWLPCDVDPTRERHPRRRPGLEVSG